MTHDNPRHDSYWLGYRHGRRLAEHEPNIDHMPALRWEAKFSSRPGRAFALGELRGYREAVGAPYVEAHRLET